MNKIINREDIIQESEPTLWFDVDRLTKDIINLAVDKDTIISVKYNDFTFANMRNVYLTQPEVVDDLPTKIVFHTYHPSVEVTIGIDDAEKYVLTVNNSELKLKDYIDRKMNYGFKLYDSEHHAGILEVGDFVRISIKDGYRSIENAYGIISNIGRKIRIIISDPDLVSRHKMKLSDGDVTFAIELSANDLMDTFIEQFELERIVP